ncbi:MAG: polysaccharide biosynthesis/export family protein [Tidjanibacter sp.]|nr:polysaccharide biosynthesis/export family protein [Tidjanibacter sp.]MBQ2247588.1 polysaccharide biosynthesis/export family protein [Tidjanibacter sp.]
MFKKVILCALAALLLASCGSHKDLAYFQEVVESGQIDGSVGKINTIQPGDVLTISVSSSRPELAVPYNLFSSRSQIATSSANSSNRIISNVTYEGYTVDAKGDIDFPVLGAIHVGGLNRYEIAEKIKEMLVPVMPDPVVTVTIVNFYVTVIGEVARPGTYNFPGDRLTLLEALGFSGDLTVYGNREKVMVIREENGGRHVEVLNLKSKDIFSSPYFYLKQNDVVYVEAVGTKAKSVSTFTTYFPVITSLASLGTAIASMLYYIANAQRFMNN